MDEFLLLVSQSALQIMTNSMLFHCQMANWNWKIPFEIIIGLDSLSQPALHIQSGSTKSIMQRLPKNPVRYVGYITDLAEFIIQQKL